MFMNGEDQDQLQLRETVGFMVYGLWIMVYGLWFMVYGLWLEILRTVLN